MGKRLFVGALLASVASGAVGGWAADSGSVDGWPASVAAFSEDTEYGRSKAGSLVNAGAANARGWTGAGVTVAVFDTGIASSSEFAGKLAVGYDAVTGRLMTSSYDVGWHGTFVAGIIAAARNGYGVEGIAYDATLLPIRIGNSDGSITLSDRQLATAIRYAAARSTVFNNSWNSSATLADVTQAQIEASYGASVAAWRQAVASGAIVVWAAGNDGKANPGFFAALPSYWTDLLSGWVVAVSVDANGVISSFSNRCGSAAAWCIAAPGENIVSVYSRGGLASASGTSFAAPVVSAAAAVLQEMWPHLTNAQVLSIMFGTANKTGIYADTSIYGQGLLDMEAATRPVGTTTVATGSTVQSTRVAASTSMAVSSPAYGMALKRLLGSTTLMVLDSYDRDFYTSAADFVAPTTHSYNAFRGMQGFGRPLRQVSEGPVSMALAPAGSTAASGSGDGFIVRAGSTTLAGRTLAVTHGVSSGFLMEGTATDTAGRAMLVDPQTVHSPFLSLGFTLNSTTRDAWGTAYAQALSPAVAVTLAGFGTTVADRPGDWAHATAYSQSAGSKSTTTGGLARLSLGDMRRRVALDVGMVAEDGTLLGAASDGALRLADGADTAFVGISADLALGDGWSLFAGAEAGRTQARAAANSLVSEVGTLTSTAWRVGLARDTLLTVGDRAVLTFSQPLRLESGTVSLSLPVGRTLDGEVTTARVSGDAGADGRELDLQAGYSRPLIGVPGEMSLSGLVRFQPDNVADARPEAVAMARYRLTF